MGFWLIDLIVVVTTACTVALSIRGAFCFVDRQLSSEAGPAVGDSSKFPPSGKGMLIQASGLVNALLGERLFSVRSIVVSTVLSATLMLTFAALFRKTWAGSDYSDVSSFLIAIPTLTAVFNLFPDCVVFIKSRVILNVIFNDTNKRQKLELIICDLVSSLLIKWVGMFAIGFVVIILIDRESPREVYESLKHLVLDFRGEGRVVVAFVLPSLSSISIQLWILLYGVSRLLVRRSGRCLVGDCPSKSNGAYGDSLHLVGNVAALLVAGVLVVIGCLLSVYPVI